MTQKVYFNHDGGVDDIISLFLLLQMKDVEIVGIGVMGADSYLHPASQASRKVIDRFSYQQNLSVAYSNSRPKHPFPTKWRMDAYSQNSLPILNEAGTIKTPVAKKAAHLDLIDCLDKQTEKITLLFTGPLTDLARALEIKPSLTKKVERLIWMGGTFLKRGNVAEPDSDGTQEWNAFYDPDAVKTVFASDLKIEMVALESTNNVPLTQKNRLAWAKKRCHIGLDFIGNSYAFVPELSHFETNSTYYLWDVLTTCYFYDPSLVKTSQVTCDVLTKHPSDGRTILTDNGRPVTLIHDVDNKRFFNLIEELALNAD